MTSESENRIRQIWDGAGAMDGASLPSPDEVLCKGLSRERAIRRRTAAWLSCAAVVAVIAALFTFHSRPEPFVLVAEAQKEVFTLPDGTVVWLNRNSRLEYDSSFGSGSRNVLLNGEAFFDVVKDAEHPFTVATEDMTVKVTGTRFTVSAYDRAYPAAWLEEGSIEVNGKGLATTVLKPDQGISFDGSAWAVSDTGASCHTSWISDRLTMENMPLDDVVASLGHWFGVNLAVSDTARAHDIKLSMTVRGESLSTILETINLLSGETVSIR